jgi:phosphate:Na+ symporter
VTFLDLTQLLGGIAIFIHGLQLAREGLQLLAAEKLRAILFALTDNRVMGLLLGVAVSAILQSSTATTVMLVGFASSSLLSVAQAMSVLLGADIGTTLTVQLIAFRLSHWALLLTFVGFAVRFQARKRRMKYIGEVVMGFGLLFFGMKLMSDGIAPLAQAAAFKNATATFAQTPLLGIAASAAFTFALGGSAPFIGLLISMAHAGSLQLDAALPMVLGANIGTTVTPLVSAVTAGPEGKRVAMAHALFKVTGVLLMLPFLEPFSHALQGTSEDPARQIANAHSLFNVLMSFAFLPFTGLAATALARFYKPEEKEKFGPKYLDLRAVETPALAFGNATREFLRMCEIVGDMLKDTIRVLEKNDMDLLARVESRDDQVDILNREIRFYLARLSAELMTEEQAGRQMELIKLTADIENIGDIINRNLEPLSRKKARVGLIFSEEGWKDLQAFHARVCENFDTAVAAFSTGDEELARRALRGREHVVELESDLRERHIQRLHEGLRESLETSSIHLDLLSYWRRINGLVCNLAMAVMKTKEQQEEK